MSWLFDRLCSIAVADRVGILVAADLASAERAGDSMSLPEVLVRAAQVPQLEVWILPASTPAASEHFPREREAVVDLDPMPFESAVETIAHLVATQQAFADAVLSLSGGYASLSARTGSGRSVRTLVGTATSDVRWLFATDCADYGDVFERLNAHDLGVAVGGVDPRASIKVNDVVGLASMVDALVALRSFAFGSTPASDADLATRQSLRHFLSTADTVH